MAVHRTLFILTFSLNHFDLVLQYTTLLQNIRVLHNIGKDTVCVAGYTRTAIIWPCKTVLESKDREPLLSRTLGTLWLRKLGWKFQELLAVHIASGKLSGKGVDVSLVQPPNSSLAGLTKSNAAYVKQ